MDKMGQSFTMTNYCNEDLCEYVCIFGMYHCHKFLEQRLLGQRVYAYILLLVYACILLPNWLCNFTFPLVTSESVSLPAQQ